MVDINKQILNLPLQEALDVINTYQEYGYTDLIFVNQILNDGNIEQKWVFEKFNTIKEKTKGINLYLGNEIFYHYKLIYHLKNNNILTLNGSNYILLKLPNDTKPLHIYSLFKILKGYNVIISCVDEYKYFSFKDLKVLKEKGALFLVRNDNVRKKKVKKLLKREMVDFLATYDNYNNKIKLRKVSKDYFQKLTFYNYQKILEMGL